MHSPKSPGWQQQIPVRLLSSMFHVYVGLILSIDLLKVTPTSLSGMLSFLFLCVRWRQGRNLYRTFGPLFVVEGLGEFLEHKYKCQLLYFGFLLNFGGCESENETLGGRRDRYAVCKIGLRLL